MPPVAEVWPEAVHKVSGKLADGRKYRIEAMVDDHRLLISTEASFENANELWLLDLTTSQAHRIVKLPEPHAGRETFASHFTVGSGPDRLVGHVHRGQKGVHPDLEGAAGRR